MLASLAFSDNSAGRGGEGFVLSSQWNVTASLDSAEPHFTILNLATPQRATPLFSTEMLQPRVEPS